MVESWIYAIIVFFISLIVSGAIIYFVTKMFGEREGFGTAMFTAFIGAIIFALTYYFIGTGWIAALISGLAWLITIGTMYKVGWLKSFIIALIVWIFAMIIGLFLPTVTGPL